jgi:hypothetical protein
MGKIIVVISGFTQKNYENTGSHALWLSLHMERDLLKCPDTKVFLREWDSNWAKEAKFFNSLEPTEVLVCAYSWGGGFGMPQLCKRLVGTPVTCVLCDPVYRSKYFWGRWLAFFDWRINVPKGVSVVTHLIQKAKWWELDGDPLKGGKHLCDTTTLDYTHTEMDESHEYHEAAVTVAKHFLGK